MEELQQELRYTFKDPSLLETALTHSSYANEVKGSVKCNERLEFLGDAVLSIVVSDFILKIAPSFPKVSLQSCAPLSCARRRSPVTRVQYVWAIT